MSDERIIIPPPEEIRRRIDQRREEIKHLKKLFSMSASAEAAQKLLRANEEDGGEHAHQ
jgi:hypothetical protein